jgi:hypothetical protein
MKDAVFPLISMVLLTVLSGSSCRVKSNAANRTSLLTRAAWKYEKKGFDSDKDGYINVLGSRLSDCEKDDTTIFNMDGSGVFKSGIRKCDLSDPPSLPFTWMLENHDSTIYFEDQLFRIKTLTNSRLEIFHEEEIGGDDVRYVIAFSH